MNFITSGRDGRNEDLDGGAKIKIWAALFWICRMGNSGPFYLDRRYCLYLL